MQKGFFQSMQTMNGRSRRKQNKSSEETGVMQISAPHFTAGLVLSKDGEEIIGAAPIIKYMVGWTKQKAIQYADRKGWMIK